MDLCNGLLKSSITYHGPQLLDELQAEQQLSLSHLSPMLANNQSKNARDEFDQRLIKFIAKKADLLFEKDAACEFHWPPWDVLAEDHFAILPPLEHFMEIPKTRRHEHFFEGIEQGHLVIAVVTAVQETGLVLNLLTIEAGRMRDLDQLKITAFCPLREIPRSHSHENVLETFSIKDKVRVVVLSIQDERVIVSLQPRNLPPSADVQLGLVNDEELPCHYRRLNESLSSGGNTYESVLREVLEFHNPSNVSNLTAMFNIRDDGQHPSLMRDLFKKKYNENDYAEKLRKGQAYRLSMRSVGEGVKHFKLGGRLEAMQLFNKALQIDAENIEALVARGALYANCESYRRAIEDFEEAIRINPSHSNAKKYLHQTLTAFAYSLMKTEIESAAKYARRALELDPDNEDTISLQKRIQQLLEPDRKVSPSGSETGHELDENQSVIIHAKETLLKMIHKDQSERGTRSKSKSFSSDGNENWIKKDRRLSYESSDFALPSGTSSHHENRYKDDRKEHSPLVKQHLNSVDAGSTSFGSKRYVKATMIADNSRCLLPLDDDPPEVFGPALPPKMLKSSKRQRKSRRSSSSSRSRSRSSSTSSTSSSTSSFSSSSSSSSSSLRSSKEKHFKESKKYKKSLKAKKYKKLKSEDKSSKKKKVPTATLR